MVADSRQIENKSFNDDKDNYILSATNRERNIHTLYDLRSSILSRSISIRSKYEGMKLSSKSNKHVSTDCINYKIN